ncbi:winged helix-turn-helix domain-containing protein, partial [Vibrio vulnificus]
MIGIYFQINDWVLCIDENKLYRQDREVSVEPRLINLLHFLAEHVGEVFGREELIQHVWDGAIVTDQVVTQSIFELRKLLRDGREENLSYVVTVPKRGYKLVANVERLTANPYLLRQAEPAEVDLLEPTITEPS